MPTAPRISLVIPAHDEEDRIGATIRAYASVFDGIAPEAYEVIVVANGCTDATVQAARRTTDFVPTLRVVNIPEPIGKGGAVIEGFRQAHGDLVIFADADAATDGQSLAELLERLGEHDIAIGSRRIAGSVINERQPLRRRIASVAFRSVVQLMFSLPYRDTQCGAKAFRAHAAKRLAESVEERQWAFDVDLLISAREHGFSIVEHPVTWTHVDGSKLKMGSTSRQVVRSFASMYLRRLSRKRVLQNSETATQ